MNKSDVVELESAFLHFCKIAQELGYDFKFPSKLELQHSSETKNSLNGRIVLDAAEYLKDSN
jgi:hypothetical protein